MLDQETMAPLRNLAEELQRQLETKRDIFVDTRRMSFVEDAGLQLAVDLKGGAESFGVNSHAHGQIAQHLGIGRPFYDRLSGDHPDLLAHLANGLLSREHTKRQLRTIDGRVRAFLSDRYRPRDNWDLLDEVVLPVLSNHSGAVTFRKCDLTETRMYVKVALPDFEKPVTPRAGDVIHGGVIIQNSEVGAGSLAIFPYTTRLICTNGMVHTDYGQRRRHVGRRIEGDDEAWEIFSDETRQLDDAAFFAKCRDTLAATLNETIFDAIVGQMRELAAIRVETPPDEAIEVFAKQHRLRDTERGSMLAALIDEGDRSAWGYVNALTRTARDLADADRQVELEKLAGDLTANPGAWALAVA